MSRYSGFGGQDIDNGILFIIALFFLACVGCSRGGCGGYGMMGYRGGCGC